MKLFFLGSLFLNILLTMPIAEARGLSAVRTPGESSAQARIRVSKNSFGLLRPLSGFTSPESLSSTLPEINTNNIPEVTSLAEMDAEFAYIRDTRFLHSIRPDFPRRMTWLFPDDGCYARAEMAAIKLMKHPFLAPKKIFAFGDLIVNSANSISGSVTWWYHVAVAYRFQQDIYIFDPAISPKHPILIQDWNNKMGGLQTEIRYAICEDRTFDPDADCLHPNITSDEDVEDEQKSYFKAEWSRVFRLNRDPEKELGDLPPWL